MLNYPFLSKRIIIATAIMMLLVFVGLYYFFDPSVEGFFPRCGFYLATGYKCPGCGSQRMIHSLLNLDIKSALRYNAYLMTVFPLLLTMLAWNGWRNFLSCKCSNFLSYFLAALLLISVLLWWVLRNVFDW